MIDNASRAEATWRMIQRNPSTITLNRGSVNIEAQTMRLTWGTIGDDSRNEAGGQQNDGRCVLFGVKNHPTVTDTNIQRGDRFAIGLVEYEVYEVLYLVGSVQAYGRRVL